jgi:4-amino-4-deoxy-L-arabinose transferase-like glycosyltransferase
LFHSLQHETAWFCIWQGRLPGVIFTFLAICLTAFLTGRMYNRRAGLLSLFTTLIIIPFVYHPIVMGRQILAEMPMMFYLLAGYSFLWLALSHSPIWGIGAAMSFGIGLHAKLQVPPLVALDGRRYGWLSRSVNAHCIP